MQKNNFKKSLVLLGIVATAMSPLTVMACNFKTKNGQKIALFGNNKYSINRFTMDEKIDKSKLALLPNLNDYFKTDLLIGGYGEGRSFYAGEIDGESKAINYHMGDDILARENTQITAPADGEVISAWWFNSNETKIADGVGGEVLVRTLIADLNISDEFKELIYVKMMRKTSQGNVIKYVAKLPKIAFVRNGNYDSSLIKQYSDDVNVSNKLFSATSKEYDDFLNTLKDQNDKKIIINASKYLYTFFIHLSKSSMNIYDHKPTIFTTENEKTIITSIDSIKPFQLKKGDIIGYVGNTLENGGWSPHVHIETYFFNPYRSSRLMRSLKQYRMSNLEKYESKLIFRSKAIGTHLQFSTETIWAKANMTFQDYQMVNRFLVKPNDIYKYYDENSEIKHIEV